LVIGFFYELMLHLFVMKPHKTYTVNEAQKALEHYCAYQERCHIEVQTKLNNMNMIPQAQEIIILHLLKENFLSEERFAKAYARGKFVIKHYGRIRIEMGLKQKQISSYLIKKGLEEIDADLYLKTISDLIEKKVASISELNPYKKKKKIIDYMLRKGYEYPLIDEAVRKYIKF
jgi:regulatory protein